MIQLRVYDYAAHTPASPGENIILSAVREAFIANSKVFDFHIVACADLRAAWHVG